MAAKELVDAGILGRVSDDSSGECRSITEQQEANRAEVSHLGWRVAAEYEDEGSASRFARKQRADWIRLLADIEAGKLGAVVLWESSRGSREPEDWFAFLRRCRDTRTLIHVTTHSRTYDMRNPRDWKTLAEDGVTNAYASEETSLRVRRALAASAAKGRPHGRPNYGYARTYELDLKKRKPVITSQLPDPATAPVARDIITRIAAAEPISVVADDLNDRGVPSAEGGRWDRSQIRRLVRNPAYIGKRQTASGNVDAIWPAIVDEATWYAAQAILSGRSATRPGAAKWLLSYIATCGPCGEPLATAMPGKRAVSHSYLCSNRHSHCVSVNQPKADAFIRRVIIERCKQPDIYTLVAGGDGKAAEQARTEAARLRHKLTEYRDLARADRISPESFALFEEDLRPRIQAAERRARDLAVPLPLRDLVEPGADIGARWDRMYAGNIAACREVVRLLLAPVAVGRATVDGARVPVEDRITFPPRGGQDPHPS